MSDFKFARAADRAAYNQMVATTTKDGAAVANLRKALSMHDVRACPGVIVKDELEAFQARIISYQIEYPAGSTGRWRYRKLLEDRLLDEAVARDGAVYAEQSAHSVVGQSDPAPDCAADLPRPPPVPSKGGVVIDTDLPAKQ